MNEEEADRFLLQPYYNFGNYNDTEGKHPERNAYPPSNPMEKYPPNYNNWKSKNSGNAGGK